MYLRIHNGPQTQFNLDDMDPQPSIVFSKTVHKFQNEQTIYQRIFEFFQNLVKQKINISSLYALPPPNTLKKSSSIQKLQILYQHPKFSSTTSISDRLSIKLYSEPSSQNFSYLTTSDLDTTLQQQSFSSTHQLTVNILQCLFDSKQQELVLVSVGIVIKYLYMTKEEIRKQNLFYLFIIGTILGNKVYHDADMPMIFKQYHESLGVDIQKIKNLERRVLKAIDYNCEVEKQTLERLRFYLFC